MRFVMDLLLGREARQRGYVLRTLLAASGYLIGVLIAEVALSIGVADLAPARVFQGAALTAGLISYAMVRWGWTRHFRDPALTVAQMLVGQTMAAVAYMLLHEFRGALIGLSVAVTSFGTFSLSRERQWAMNESRNSRPVYVLVPAIRPRKTVIGTPYSTTSEKYRCEYSDEATMRMVRVAKSTVLPSWLKM